MNREKPNFRVLTSIYAYNSDCRAFSESAAEAALEFHKTLPGYAKTPLVSLECAAAEYGIDSIFVKDESKRFGLKAFKGLGGSYSMFRILCERLSLDYRKADFNTFRELGIRNKCAGIEFVTATDGNH
ncbi:MAG: hypothetical protein J5622_00350, partial [Firmicutes bacterium]|nr:hypothetical protein [Bacillota bacterium]